MSVETINLRKDTIINLKKNLGIRGQIAQVVFALDFSGSMWHLFQNGAVQRVIERILPVGLSFDDNKSVEMFLFHHGFIARPDVTIENYSTYLRQHVPGRDQMGSTNYAPVLNEIVKKHVGIDILGEQNPIVAAGNSIVDGIKNLFGFGKKEPVPATNTPTVQTKGKTLQIPVYVIFLTDGNNDDKENTERVIREAAKYGIFFQFIGIGREQFFFLKKLDTLTGRLIDNAGFIEANSLDDLSDDELYGEMIKEFKGWLSEAKHQSLIAG